MSPLQTSYKKKHNKLMDRKLQGEPHIPLFLATLTLSSLELVAVGTGHPRLSSEATISHVWSLLLRLASHPLRSSDSTEGLEAPARPLGGRS